MSMSVVLENITPGARIQENILLTTFNGFCPGGSNWHAEVSTTRSPHTPKTFPCESTTAFGLLAFPIAPNTPGSIS